MSAVIERVSRCPKETALQISLIYYLCREEDGEARRRRRHRHELETRSRRKAVSDRMQGECEHRIRRPRTANRLPLRQTRPGEGEIYLANCHTPLRVHRPTTPTNQHATSSGT